MNKIIMFIGISFSLWLLLVSCSALGTNTETPAIDELETPPLKTGALQVSYQIGDALDAQVVFENRKAYDAVQLGLTLLASLKGLKNVPSVEDPEFFPEFFAMVNIDVSDGLLYVSQKEAVDFARSMFLAYQKKITPAEHLRAMQERRVVENFDLPPR